MSHLIYLVRHAESEHNVSKDFSQRDPPLTSLGLSQASALADTFPDPGSIATVFTSPLTRTLQTTLAGFSHIISEQYLKSQGSSEGARLIIDKDLQERSDLPCDTGSKRSILEKAFPLLDFGSLDEDWFTKDSLYTADDSVVAARAKIFRERLRKAIQDIEASDDSMHGRKHIVVITHGVFMKYLCEDMTIDLPKAGWKTFTLNNGASGEAILIPVK
ncbi:phosphoglycerate mutase family protein [Stachybotrys elegans]|uniref:Phosphoglycerate mutase family protein n=1 Tax=Stachybotrys elegans TaxID=80388 RepID=A0A8K0WNC1_9HYPO|nr:phosphoglycerate mutase family protein [Stachybotrys elegans]